jgi:two-component system sensor kinase FixL
MYLLVYNFPEDLIDSLEEIATAINCTLRVVNTINELNDIQFSDYNYILAYGCDDLSLQKINLKTGNRKKVICCNGLLSNCNYEPDIFEFISFNEDDISTFKIKISEVIKKKQKNIIGTYISDFKSRLDVIHQLTRKALNSSNEVDVQEFMLKKLVEFYNADSCTQLIYDDDGDLFIYARAESNGSFRSNIFEKVENKQDYEECSSCGQPIINCRSFSDTLENYFCAPIINQAKITGLIRITYRSKTVDLEIDKVILLIAADILAAVNIRSEALKALLESENKTRTILETTVDAIITIDERGNIETFNLAAEKLFGYSSDEVKGKNIKILMPDPYVHEHDEYLERYHRTGERQIIGIGREVVGKRKNGTLFPMYLAVSELNLAGRKIYTGIVRDITEERRLEKEVMRISEHERHRIGQDLHDGLGQMLSGIGLLSRHMVKRLKAESHYLSADMEEIADLLKESDDFSRNLAHGLVKIDLDRGGFNAALEELVRQSVRLFRISCEFKASNEINLNERTSAEHLYRIIQEGINNAVKHGQADHVVVSALENRSFLRFQIKDNGIGFPANWREKEGMGVRIMEYRARLIGAHIDISNNINKGATITCTLLKNLSDVEKENITG